MISGQDVDLARRFFDATERALAAYWLEPRSVAEMHEQGEPTMQAAFACLHHDIIWNPGDLGSFQGKAQVAAGWDEFLEIADEYKLSAVDLRQGPDGIVYAAVNRTITARESGLQTTIPVFTVIKIEDGLIRQMDDFLDRDEALGLAGLAP